MSRNSASFCNSGAYTSPGTPDYGDNIVGGGPKGWSSERVPLPNNGSHRHISTATFMPFNSGRALPSKWDDAERWINSPVSGSGSLKTLSAQAQRHPKSKSGPLGGTPGVAYFSNYSPAAPVLAGGSKSNLIAASPLTTGVLVADGLSVHNGGGIGAHSNPADTDYEAARSSCVPGWPELMIECSFSSSQDDKPADTSDTGNGISRVISKRDMATQMSPFGSTQSSPRGNSLLSSSQSLPLGVKPGSNLSIRAEVRDVQVDKGAIMTEPPKTNGLRVNTKASSDAKDLACTWDAAEGAVQLPKIQKEEARIDSWERLQNVKAEAAIQKLEMKLEKKRSASMNKILNKLRAAQMKAQDMRRSMSESPAHQPKAFSFRKYFKMSSLRACFSCRAS